MLFNPYDDELVTIHECRKLFPSSFKSAAISPRTLQRWIRNGRGGVKLASIKIGGIRYTSKGAIAQFISESSGDATAAPQGAVRAPRIRSTRQSNASAKLNSLGF